MWEMVLVPLPALLVFGLLLPELVAADVSMSPRTMRKQLVTPGP